MSALDITEVARRSGVPASALRFYEEKGLIRSVGRRGLRRLFEPTVFERLALVHLGRAAGFSLDEIARMFAPDGRPRIDRPQLIAKAEELDGTIRRLTRLRDGLRHAAACPAPSHMECPKFQRLLRAATRRPVPSLSLAAPRRVSAAYEALARALRAVVRDARGARRYCRRREAEPGLPSQAKLARAISSR